MLGDSKLRLLPTLLQFDNKLDTTSFARLRLLHGVEDALQPRLTYLWRMDLQLSSVQDLLCHGVQFLRVLVVVQIRWDYLLAVPSRHSKDTEREDHPYFNFVLALAIFRPWECGGNDAARAGHCVDADGDRRTCGDGVEDLGQGILGVIPDFLAARRIFVVESFGCAEGFDFVDFAR